jgi:hypothetical protein
LIREDSLSPKNVSAAIAIGDWLCKTRQQFSFQALFDFYQYLYLSRAHADNYLPFTRWLVLLLDSFPEQASECDPESPILKVAARDAWSLHRARKHLAVSTSSDNPWRALDFAMKSGVDVKEADLSVTMYDQGYSPRSWLELLYRQAQKKHSRTDVRAAICYAMASSIVANDESEAKTGETPLDLSKRSWRYDYFKDSLDLLSRDAGVKFDVKSVKNLEEFQQALTHLWASADSSRFDSSTSRSFILMAMATHGCPYDFQDVFLKRFSGQELP